MAKSRGKTYLYIALLFGILFHGVLVFFTFEKTYDAYVHIFFADHYAEQWFDHWDYRWYTGFTLVSYPPLIHQCIALLSFIVGLKTGFIIMAMAAVALFIRGVFVFSRLWVDETSAGMASLIAIVSSSFVEALHIFGQLPSVTGIALLLNLCPIIYRWIRYQRWWDLLLSISFLAVITTIHHVTTIFGMVFFIFPVIGLALMDNAIVERGGVKHVRFKHFITHLIKIIKPSVILGILTIFIALLSIFPYWTWSRSDPISQVPIPHGSRDSFIEVFSSGLVFFLIPWGMMLFFLPFLFRKIYQKRTIILALSFSMAFLLGTGGTTPIPRLVLGDTAFNILTLDRFTYWASIMALPFFGYYIQSLLFGKYKDFLLHVGGSILHRFMSFFWIGGLLLVAALVINVGYFQPLQPEKVEIQPILNFLERDQHDKWRYLTLGFGDQVAWLSANTDALTVDGNYHSVRRLPELTTRKVERLENSKYLGTQGIAALQQFLTIPEKYHLKYIFSNDQFYNPILHFSGWQRLRNLENNIQVWEKPDIPSLPSLLPRKDIPRYQQMMWSLIPVSALLLLLFMLFLLRNKDRSLFLPAERNLFFLPTSAGWTDMLWSIGLLLYIGYVTTYQWKITRDQYSPENLITAYFDALDFKEFDRAFRYFDPDNAPTVDQMLLDLSQEDAITLSYAKLNNLTLRTIYDEKGRKARVMVKADWITSIDTYVSYHDFDVYKKDHQWWIQFDEREVRTPPDQLLVTPDVDYKNQGRRDARISGTDHQDIMDRPEVYINNAELVKRGEQYHLIGLLQNIDNDPAYVTITGTLYDENGKEIVTYNAKEVVIHNLLPKEKTYFRIDFEDVAYQLSKSNFPKIFDPSFSNPFQFLEKPVRFRLNVKSVVTTTSLYKFYGIGNLQHQDSLIQGTFINTGTLECNIPQIITAFYKNNDLLWVDSQFLEKGIRPQRSRSFTVELPKENEIQNIKNNFENELYINGQNNSRFYQKWLDDNRKTKTDFFRSRSSYLVDIIPSGYVSQE